MAIDKYSDEEFDHNETLLNGFLIAVYLLSLTALLMSVSGSSFGDMLATKESDLLISTNTSKPFCPVIDKQKTKNSDTICISNLVGIDVTEASDTLLKHVNGKGASVDSNQVIQKVILWDEGNKTKKGVTVNPTYTDRHSITTTTKRY
jgi:hypothetical protein